MEENTLTVEESYEIIEEVLKKFYNNERISEIRNKFDIALNSPERIAHRNRKREKQRINEIRENIKALTGLNLSDDDINKMMNKDTNHIKNLSIDQYMEQIERIFNETKVAKRSNDKPMMTPIAQTGIGNSASEAHLTSRGIHQQQVSDLSAELASALGLNIELARIGGKHHDDGHTNSGHTGERIATTIGKLNNCGYIVHNALSADMLISENIINKVLVALEKKEPNMTQERKDEIVKDIWYIFDIAISHNGEGKDRVIYYNPNKTVEDIKNDKNRCYTESGYDRKIHSATKEGAIIAWADKLCYIRTDIQDGVNLGILTEFNDNYLRYIGILAAKTEKPKLYELAQKIFKKEEELEKQLSDMQSELKDAGIKLNKPEDATRRTIFDIRTKTEIEPEEYIKTIKDYSEIKGLSKDVMRATTECGRLYVESIPVEKRAEKVVNMIKDTCVEDLIEYSTAKEYVGISPAIAKAFFGIRNENLEQIVKYSRRKFEKELLPQAELQIHSDLKNALLETGIIREFMSRRRDEEYGEVELFELTEEEKQARSKYGLTQDLEIKDFDREHTDKKDITGRKSLKPLLKYKASSEEKYKYERKVCHNFIRLFKSQPQRTEEILQNALNAGLDIAIRDVEAALENKEPADNEILGQEYYEKVMKVKENIDKRYPKGFANRGEKIAYANELANRRKNDHDGILASAVALEYVAGMTDGTVIEASKLKGYLTNETIEEGYKREGAPEKQLTDMQAHWNEEAKANVEIAIALEKILESENLKFKKNPESPNDEGPSL